MRTSMWRCLGLALFVTMLSSLGCTGDAGKPGEPGAEGMEGAEGKEGVEGAEGVPGGTGDMGPGPSAADIADAVTGAVDDRLGAAVGDAVKEEIDARATGCAASPLSPEDFDFYYGVEKHLLPRQEGDFCMLIRSPNRTIYLNDWDVFLSAGSHHGLIARTDFGTELPTEDYFGYPVELGKVVTCEEGAGQRFGNGEIIGGSMGSKNVYDYGKLPDNVAKTIPANTILAVELHMLNASDEEIDACFAVGMTGIPKSQYKYELGGLGFYNPMITVPAGGTGRARMACPVTHDVKMAWATSHMHNGGVGYKARLLDGDPYDPATKVVRTLYDYTSWDDPDYNWFDKPIDLKAGQWIEYWCDYENNSDVDSNQGLDTTDQMCMLFAGTWPETPDRVFEGCFGIYNVGNGDMNGNDFLNCFWATDFQGGAALQVCGAEECADNEAKFAFQSCFTDSCNAIGEYTRPYSDCVGANAEAITADCMDAQTQFQTICAVTASASGGCAEAFGTDGSDGTCATGADTTDAAVETCMEDIRQAQIAEVCMTLPNAAGGCAEDCAADPTAAGCTTCLGAVDFDGGNTKCLNQHSLGCLGEEIPELAEACVTECFTGCITTQVGGCVVDNLHSGPCAAEVTGLVTTSCD